MARLLDGADFNAQRAQNAADPTSAQDLATKNYADTKLNYRGAWSASTSYAVGDVVTNGNKSYACVSAVNVAGVPNFIDSATSSGTVSGTSAAMTIPTLARAGDLAILLVKVTGAPTLSATGLVVSGVAADGFGNNLAVLAGPLTSAMITAATITVNGFANTNNYAVDMLAVRNVDTVQLSAFTSTLVSPALTPAATPGVAIQTAAVYTSAASPVWTSPAGIISATSPVFSGTRYFGVACTEAAVPSGTVSAQTFAESSATFATQAVTVYTYRAGVFPAGNFDLLAAYPDLNANLHSGTPVTAGQDVALYGPLTTPLTSQSLAYTLTSADGTVLESGVVTVTLPTAVGCTGRIYTIKCTGTSGLIPGTTSSQTIDGLAGGAFAIAEGYSITVQSDGSNWRIIGHFAAGPPLLAKSSLYTVGAADLLFGGSVLANGTFTVTLPTAINVGGRSVTIKNVGAGTITLATTSSQTIDGAAPGTLAAHASVTLQSDNANWQIIAKV